MPRFHLPALLIAAASWAIGASVGEIPHLPFGIDAQTPLEKVEITLDFFSAKTGAGTQRITLRGDGAVRLDFARSSQDKHPKSLERNCGPAAVIRLLDFMEGYGFLDMPDQIGGPPKGRSQRVLELTLTGKTKRIALTDECGYAIEEILGAVKVTAGQCLPEALNHRFFPNL